jgi:hypothetical protein
MKYIFHYHVDYCDSSSFQSLAKAVESLPLHLFKIHFNIFIPFIPNFHKPCFGLSSSHNFDLSARATHSARATLYDFIIQNDSGTEKI